jgi:predicted PurR-regulated permease PerM
MNQANWQQRRDIVIFIIGVGVILWAIWGLVGQFFDAVFLLLISMAIAFLISPAVNALQKLKVPRILAALICYVIAVGALGGLFYALIFSFINQATAFTQTIEDFVNALPHNYTAFIEFLEKQGGIPHANILQAIDQIQTEVGTFVTDAAKNIVNILSVIANTFLNFIVVLVLSFYLTLDGKRIRDSIIGIVPRRWMSHTLLFEDALNRVVGNYIRGQLTLALFIGVATAIVCTATGIGQFALIFGVLGFFFETIPMVGPALASVSPLLVSLLLPDPMPRTLIIVICFVALQAFESNVLGPRIVGHAVGLHPVASILALLIFAKIFGTMFGAFGGALGALVATPIVAAIWVVIASVYRSYRGETPEQIISRKKAPWTFRRPGIPGLRSASGKLPEEDQDTFSPEEQTEAFDFVSQDSLSEPAQDAEQPVLHYRRDSGEREE